MNRLQKYLNTPAVPAQIERQNLYIGFVYTFYYLLGELKFLENADYVKRAWHGEIEGVCTWPEDGYGDTHAFGELDDAVDYFIPNYSVTAVFQTFKTLYDEMIFSPEFQNESGYCDIEIYISSQKFCQLMKAAKNLHADMSTKLIDNNIDIDRLRAEIIDRL